MTQAPVRSGLEVFLQAPAEHVPLSTGRPWRTALLGHPASIDGRFRHAIDLLVAHPQFELVRLFGPEHGIRGEAQDMEKVESGVDPLTGIESHSLYGTTFDSLTPAPELLDGLDLLVVDLQDVGARYYTFIATIMLCMRAATAAGVHTVVLDRPNPIGGTIEGPGLQSGFESFVGLVDVPTRHGMTPAEFVAWAIDHTTFFPEPPAWSAALCTGWTRDMFFEQTGLPWVFPSPNMPTVDTAVVYPGQCLIEGTDLSEGRGTTRPFELFGAPIVDLDAVEAILADAGITFPGMTLRPVSMTPMFQKHARTRCSGWQMHVTDRHAFRSVRATTALLWALRKAGAGFDWRRDAYEFVSDIPAIDLLFGSQLPRLAIDSGVAWSELEALLATPQHHLAAISAARFSQYAASP